MLNSTIRSGHNDKSSCPGQDVFRLVLSTRRFEGWLCDGGRDMVLLMCLAEEQESWSACF